MDTISLREKEQHFRNAGNVECIATQIDEK
jgi:hypothetical protein